MSTKRQNILNIHDGYSVANIILRYSNNWHQNDGWSIRIYNNLSSFLVVEPKSVLKETWTTNDRAHVDSVNYGSVQCVDPVASFKLFNEIPSWLFFGFGRSITWAFSWKSLNFIILSVIKNTFELVCTVKLLGFPVNHKLWTDKNDSNSEASSCCVDS